MRIYEKMTPLTEEERIFAEQNHYILENYLRYHRLPYDKYYEICVFGYLKAVKRWFSRQKLHRYSFVTVANKAMWSYLDCENKKQQRRIRAVSLDEVIPGTEGVTYMEAITYRNIDFQYQYYG